MSEQQYNQLMSMYQALSSQLSSLMNTVNELQRRISDLERSTSAGPSHPRRPDHPIPGPPLGSVAPRPGVGSRDNASWLPFAIERIADHHDHQNPNNRRACQCGAEVFSFSCFRADHFRWCRQHDRPILPPHLNCGRDYHGCLMVRWENHPDWERIVQFSKASGNLPLHRVPYLDELLFPRDLYPNKYDTNGNFTG